MTLACVDANVLISFLLAPSADRPPSIIVRAGFASHVTLAVSETTIEDMMRSIRDKRYLRDRIGVERGDAFIAQLRAFALVLPELDELPTAVVRDPGDNYLIAHLQRDRPDYLVTGDSRTRESPREDTRSSPTSTRECCPDSVSAAGSGEQ